MNGESHSNLKQLLDEYCILTCKLIEVLEKDEFNLLEQYFEYRQSIISKIDKMDFNPLVFKQICENNSLLVLQKKLTLLMNEKKCGIKNQINNLEGTKLASRNYKKDFSIDSLYFNKKI